MRYIILFFATYLFSANLIIQYPNLKKEYYNNQIIDLNIRVITPKEENLTFVPPLNSEINVTKSSPLIYNIDLKFKNLKNKNKMLFIISDNVYKQILLNKLYKTVDLDKTDNFCGVLAESLNVQNILASKYDKNHNIISFTLTGKNANLKDFTLHLKDENLTVVNKNKATYLATLNSDVKTLTFYYFNTLNDNFEKITVPVNIKEETISTQTDLNPEENTLFTPLNILLLGITALLLIIFLVYQKVWLIFPPLILTAVLIYNNLPKGNAFLVRGTDVYILPTKNSTVFYKAPVGVEVKILKKTENYTKIKINNKIGWVKNEDLK